MAKPENKFENVENGELKARLRGYRFRYFMTIDQDLRESLFNRAQRTAVVLMSRGVKPEDVYGGPRKQK